MSADMNNDQAKKLQDMHLRFIEEKLLPEILQQFQNEELHSYEKEHSTGLDGFMSALYKITLKTIVNQNPADVRERALIVKFMKGDPSFRESTKSYIQFANEILIYSKVLPAYEELLKQASISDLSTDNLVPHAYVAKYGFVEGLSANNMACESVLVLENLRPLGYTLGPRLYLRLDHLLAMAKIVGQYHALGYALHMHNPKRFEMLKNQVVPLPFYQIDSETNDPEHSLYRTLYRVAFDRFFAYFDRKLEDNTISKLNRGDVKLIERVNKLRVKYFEEPTLLLEHLRVNVENSEKDSRFAAILHGDYNRNNVLFRYQMSNGEMGDVEDVKMIDFQELRFGTPAIDLSFFMYFNSPKEVRDNNWQQLLKEYHQHMYSTLQRVIGGLHAAEGKELTDAQIDSMLEKYQFEHFNAHFTRFAMYGVMVCLHFLPWMLCSEAECDRLSYLFETDMHSEEFHKLSIEAGGDPVNESILDIVRHASDVGYLDFL